MMKRLITMLTALMLLCSLLGSTMAEVKQAGTFYTRTADPETLDGWEELFGADVNTTENVGTVWTDKTVTTSVPSATEFQSITMENDKENFLVTLSALSATKSITGHETLPTDTVFVLDLSSSMYRIDDNNYSTATVGPMVDAANEAIHKLLDLNPLNRVGVVIYYGFESIWRQSDTTHHVSLLQLDSFDLLDDQKYLVMNTDSSNRLRGIKVNDNLKVRGTNTKATTTPYVMPGKLSDSSSNIAGTYMQLGIKKALDMMLQSDPHIPADEGFQAGATRIPIMVLMSDGEPTAAHNLFSKLETPDDTEAITGNNVVNERSAAESDFLTQLTAGMARKVLDMHYDATTPLFYTLGLGTSLSYDVMDPRNNDVKYNGDTATLAAQYTCNTGRAHANYPSGTTNLPSGGNAEYQNTKEQVNAKIKTYWNDILSGDNKATITYLRNVNWAWKRSQTATVSAISTYTGGGKTFTFSEPFPSSIEDKYYVDKFFSANTASELSTAFSSLVEEIKLQSAYFPTYVENGAIGMSGYLEFHDEIGDMLQVKKVHGLVRQATASEISRYHLEDDYFYYTGKQLAEYVKNARNDATKLAEFKVVLGKLLKARFKITDEAKVQAAVDEIIKPDNKMFYYVSETDYGNIIRWYADEDEKYLALKTATSTQPSSAKYLMESYWYADTTSAAAMEDYNSIIRIKTDLETGKQCVLWSVPASMIPLVRYEVTLSGNSLENPGTIKVDYTSNNPMRAVIEVGLRDGVTKYNAVEELTEAGYQPDADGKYTFFSNKWTETLPNPSVNSIHDTHNATSHFKPSLQNERYNITADTLVYVKDGEGYKEYTGDSKPSSGGKYYVVNYAFKAQGDKWNAEDNEADLVPSYMLLTSGFGNAKKVDGKWYISTGTATYPGHQYIEKDPNITQSVTYSFYETVRDEEQVVSILGNNGTFSFVPDTGMTITKKLSGNETTTQKFTFIITPAEGTLADSYDVTWLENGQALENGEAVATSTSGNKLTVALKAGQTVYIPGLPAGNYTVLEQVYAADGSYTYEVSAVKIGGSAVRDPAAASDVPVTANQMIAVEYTNRRVESGSIKIEKTTTSSVDGVTLPANQAFTFQVELGEDNANKSFPLTWADNATGTAEADNTGKLTVTVKANDHVIISGVPRNTSATVTEINLPDGYVVAQGTLNPQTRTVEEGQTASFAFANVYKPEKAPVTITLTGEKTLTGRDWLDSDTFSFQLQYNNNGTWTDLGNAVTVSKASTSFDLTEAMQDFTFDAPGTYSFRVVELGGSIPGISYDTGADAFDVVIADEDVDGVLEIKAVTAVSGAEVTSGSNGFAVATAFTNYYTSVTLSGSKTLTGRDLKDNEFTFVLTEMKDGTFAESVENVQPLTTTNVGGTFTFAEIPYANAGTYYYTIAEQSGSLPGVTYDGTVYYVTVTVTDNTQSGKLEVSVTYQTKDEQGAFVEAEAVAFANSYKAADNTATFSGVKTLTGRELAAGEFTFVLTETESDFVTVKAGGEQQTATNAADGSFFFEKIDYDTAGTYYYTVTEDESTPLASVTYDKTIYQITVSVVDNTANGTLDVTTVVTKASKEAATEGIALAADPIPLEYDELDFTNVYDAVDTSVTLEGSKTLEGRALADNEFTFVLTETESDFATAKAGGVTQTATNVDGSFTFAEIPYVQAGTYYYTIAEQPGSLPGVTYDSTVYYVKVVVTDNTQSGKLEVATTYQTKDEQGAFVNAEAVAFANSYKAADNTATFSGKKTLTGRELAAGEFTFVLTETESDFVTVKAGGEQQTATNSADGSFFFEIIDYDTAGTYYYTVTEDDSTPLASVTYDKTIYQITVTVVDNTANGTLDVTAVVTKASKEAATEGIALAADPIPLEYDELDFTNVYDAVDTSVTLNGNKTLTGRTLADKEFTFTLYNADAEYNIISEVETVANDAEGKFAFTEIPYDTVGAYYYVVRENSASVPYITTDAAEYRIQVDVKDMGGELAAECTALRVADGEGTAEDVIAEGMSFTNRYVPFSVSVALRGEKRYTGAALEEGMFTFQLYAADSNFNPIGMPQQTVVNKEDGSFIFRTLTFGGTGVYRYVIVEDASQALPGVTYDPTVYQVTITVSDHGTGYLVADVSISSNGEEAEKAVFENFYHEIPNTGDHSSIEFMLALCLTSLTALMAMMILGRRRVRG